jgi:uncharacterized membrane protein (UPF0136 family)
MPTLDANLRLRQTSDGVLTATAVFSADLGGTPLRGMAVRAYVPVVDTAEVAMEEADGALRRQSHAKRSRSIRFDRC